MRMATEDGAKARSKARGGQYKKWITVGDERVSDMDIDNQAQGWIKIDEAFSSGNQNPPSHPNCRCTLAYMNMKPDAEDQDIVDQTIANQAQASGG